MARNIYTNYFMVREKHKGMQKELILGWTKKCYWKSTRKQERRCR
jgi:hypothetical protein